MVHIFSGVTELYRELTDLPHATKGDPEDADTTADDHAADALRYLLTNLGSGPDFLILDDLPAEGPDSGTVLLTPTVAYRPDHTAPSANWWDEDDETPHAGGTVQSPWD